MISSWQLDSSALNENRGGLKGSDEILVSIPLCNHQNVRVSAQTSSRAELTRFETLDKWNLRSLTRYHSRISIIEFFSMYVLLESLDCGVGTA